MMKLRSSLLLMTVLMLAACSSEEGASGLFGNSQEQGEEVDVTLPLPFIKGLDADELVPLQATLIFFCSRKIAS